jgi:hypothetical protein
VRDHARTVLVRFVDDRAVERRRKLLYSAVAIVDPDLDEVHLSRDLIADGLARLGFGLHPYRRRLQLRRTRTSVRRRKPTTGPQESRPADAACSLIGAQLLGDWPGVGAHRQHGRDPRVRVAIQLIDQRRARVSCPPRN